MDSRWGFALRIFDLIDCNLINDRKSSTLSVSPPWIAGRSCRSHLGAFGETFASIPLGKFRLGRQIIISCCFNLHVPALTSFLAQWLEMIPMFHCNAWPADSLFGPCSILQRDSPGTKMASGRDSTGCQQPLAFCATNGSWQTASLYGTWLSFYYYRVVKLVLKTNLIFKWNHHEPVWGPHPQWITTWQTEECCWSMPSMFVGLGPAQLSEWAWAIGAQKRMSVLSCNGGY